MDVTCRQLSSYVVTIVFLMFLCLQLDNNHNSFQEVSWSPPPVLDCHHRLKNDHCLRRFRCARQRFAETAFFFARARPTPLERRRFWRESGRRIGNCRVSLIGYCRICLYNYCILRREKATKKPPNYIHRNTFQVT